MVSFRLRTSHGRAYDSHHRTAGIAGCTRRRGGRVATCGAGAAASKVADHWHFWGGHSFSLESVDRQLCTTTARTWVDRGTHYCDRVSLGRWTKRALRRDRSRVRPAEGRCHPYGAKSGARIKAGDVGYPDRDGNRDRPDWNWNSCQLGAPRRQRHWPVTAGYRSRRQTARTLASYLLACAVWRSWPTLAFPPRCWRWGRLWQLLERLVSMLLSSKSAGRKISFPPSRLTRVARMRFILLQTRS